MSGIEVEAPLDAPEASQFSQLLDEVVEVEVEVGLFVCTVGFWVYFWVSGVDLWIMNRGEVGEVVYWHVLGSAAMKMECINGGLDKLLHLGMEKTGFWTFWT